VEGLIADLVAIVAHRPGIGAAETLAEVGLELAGRGFR
jgi:hypothetical protein